MESQNVEAGGLSEMKPLHFTEEETGLARSTRASGSSKAAGDRK